MVMTKQTLKNLITELRQLQVVYGFMIQNAPTEEARRIVEMNLMTACLERLEGIFYEMTGEMLPPYYGEPLSEVPVFATFIEAARFAFLRETQVVRLLKDLHRMADECHHMTIFDCIVEHMLNAMRMLYLIG